MNLILSPLTDENGNINDRRASLLSILIKAWIVFILIGMFTAIARGGITWVDAIYVANIAVGAFALRLNAQGHTRLAAYLFCYSYFFILFAGFGFIIYSEGAETSALNIGVAYLLSLSILLAGLLIGGRAALHFAIINTVSIVAVFLASADNTMGTQILGAVGLLFTFQWLLALIAWLYESALERAFTRLKDAKEGLEGLVEDRTQELKTAKEAAEMANISKSTFLSSMSHELRTPLNAILGFAQIMERDVQLTSTQHRHLNVIMQSGEHLLELINDVLEMSKIEAGHITVNLEHIDLYRVLNGLSDMLTLRAENKGLQLRVHRAEHVPQYIVADERKLRQVLLNLMGNAIKFTQHGHITLHVACTSCDDHWVLLDFAVSDTGLGIAPTEIERLFAPFVQTESGRKVQEGTGLGLPISQQFVRLMGGEIKVNSQVGVGSTFSFQLKLERSSANDVNDLRDTRRVIGLKAGQPPYRILIVEDRWANRILLHDLLEPLGFQLRTAINGKDALKIWQEWQPHVICMDMQMPILDGYETTRHIKASQPNIVIIALTASAFDHERQQVLAVGCDDYIAKPFREAEIFSKLSQHLGVEYVYEEREIEQTPTDKDLRVYLKQLAVVRSFPVEWRQRLAHAAEILDSELSQEIVQEIENEYPEVAQTLLELVQNFQFETLMHLAATPVERK